MKKISFCIKLLLIPFYFFGQDSFNSNQNVQRVEVDGKVVFYEKRLVPKLNVVKENEIELDNVKGFIFTDVFHHSKSAGMIRKHLNDIFSSYPKWTTNKKKWKSKDPIIEDYVYVSFDSRYVGNNFIAEWSFLDDQKDELYSFWTVNMDYPAVIKDILNDK